MSRKPAQRLRPSGPPSALFVVDAAAETDLAIFPPCFPLALRCLRPAAGSWSERHAPLKQRLVRGRVCAHELCAVDNCALHLRDEVLLPTEADLLISHGELVLKAEGAERPYGDNGCGRSRCVVFMQSVTYGSQRHLSTVVPTASHAVRVQVLQAGAIRAGARGGRGTGFEA
jgi:hypothetical protein